jgi:RNA polymerase sigma-70 factor (ECF subfamily)
MARLATGDVEALEGLYDRYGMLVYSTALRVAREVHLAEDIAQEVFLSIWRHPDRYVPQRGSFVPWLLSVARNRAVDQVRSRGRRQRHQTGGEVPERGFPTGDRDDPVLMAEPADERQRVQHALSRLPAKQRQTIEMAYIGGYSQQEIAILTSEPLGTVKTRIRLGMQKLRLLLMPEVQLASPQRV